MNSLEFSNGDDLLKYHKFRSDSSFKTSSNEATFCSKKLACGMGLGALIIIVTTITVSLFQGHHHRSLNPSTQDGTKNPTISPTLAPSTSYLRSNFPSFIPTSAPSGTSLESGAPSYLPTSFSSQKKIETSTPSYYPTTSSQLKEIYLENETPYSLCLTSSWQNGVYCKNGCKDSLAPQDKQVMFLGEEAPSYAKAGLYYNMETSSSCNGGFQASFGVTISLVEGSLVASLSSDGGGKLLLTEEDQGYGIQANEAPFSSPSLAPTPFVSSAPSLSQSPTMMPVTLVPSTHKPTISPSLSRAPSYQHTAFPTSSAIDIISQQSVYIDEGILYGQWVYGNAIQWNTNPYTLNKAKVDEEIHSILNQLELAGVQEIRHAFSQVDNILNIENGVRGDSKDTISIIYSDDFLVEGTNQNFLQYMNFMAEQKGFQATLSDGGALAESTQMKLPSDAQTSATTLLEMMKRDGFHKIDFDIESSSAFSSATTAESLQFFQLVKEGLENEGKASVGTFMGCVNNIPSVFVENMNSYFSEVSLMLYSTNQYYLDATGTCWSLERWIEVVGDPKKISVLFYDSIAYEDPSTSGGAHYEVSGLTRGQAAASIYLQVLGQLGLNLTSLAPTGWWTDHPTTLPNNQVLKDFYDYLKNSG